MTYKTIVTHLDASASTAERTRVAAELAQKAQGHLVGLAPTGIANIPNGDYMGGAIGVVAELQRRLDDSAQAAAEAFKAQCKQIGVGSYEPSVVVGGTVDVINGRARYADLVVMGQGDNERTSDHSGSGLIGSVLLGAGRPLLVVPHVGVIRPIGHYVLFAWDGSREAARAATAALPLMRTAANVEVIVVNASPNKGRHGEDPGTDIALFLARHAVRAQVKAMKSSIDVANTLLSHAADVGADLLVMGGYGHSRLREWVLGGTTRTILDSMTIPVLMSH